MCVFHSDRSMPFRHHRSNFLVFGIFTIAMSPKRTSKDSHDRPNSRRSKPQQHHTANHGQTAQHNQESEPDDHRPAKRTKFAGCLCAPSGLESSGVQLNKRLAELSRTSAKHPSAAKYYEYHLQHWKRVNSSTTRTSHKIKKTSLRK